MASKRTKKRTGRKNTKAKEPSFIRDEIIILGTLAVSILLLISNFGIAGFVGNAISTWMMKIFGWVSFAVPFILFVGVAFVIPNRENSVAYIKMAAGICLTILVCTFFELVSNAGGYIGSGIAKLLTPAIGIAGTYVIIIILSLICVVMITEKSLLKGVRQSSARASDKAKEAAEKYKTRN